MGTGPKSSLAVWALTPKGLNLARRIKTRRPGVTIRCARRLARQNPSLSMHPFRRLTEAVAQELHAFDGHIFIMASGIVVRAIAPWLKHKTVDPAVVVVDDQGQYAVSLLAGHIGGANALTEQIAGLIGALPVITTATDVNARPAIDLIAARQGLSIENPDGIKAVNMALLTDQPIEVHDPYALVTPLLDQDLASDLRDDSSTGAGERPAVYVDDRGAPRSGRALILRPSSLIAGIGCNRDTPAEEIRTLLEEVLRDRGLSPRSLRKIASIDVKRDEPGLLALGRALQVPVRFYSRAQLKGVRQVPNPSAMVAKHVGVESVCEAAAILAADQGALIVPKQKTSNVTLAIARHASMSSASAPEA